MYRKVIKYVYSHDLIEEADRNPAVKGRASMTHSLIKAYDLCSHVKLLPAKKCNSADLRGFHSRDYIDQFRHTGNRDSKTGEDEQLEEEYEHDSSLEEYGLGFDCPMWPGMLDYACCIAGATMTACEALCHDSSPARPLEQSPLIINWTGGWHHAHRDKAGGFCYVNDIVLGILVLRKRYQRVLYVDLDVHHGDGVQGAFETTKRVFTLSIHQHECGFYPGSGVASECGMSGGKGYAVNFPYQAGISSVQFTKFFKRIAARVLECYKPEVCVIQCGADAIVGDPLGGTNLTVADLIDCLTLLVGFGLPTLLLGGGGYNFANASRYWTQITAAICGQSLCEDIPECCDSFLAYGPDYSLHIAAEKHRKDLNTSAYLEECAQTIEANLERYNVSAI